MMKNYLVIHRRAKTHVDEVFQNLFIVQAQTHDEAAEKTRPEALFGLLVTTIEVNGEPWQYYNAVRNARERNMIP